MTVTRPIQVVSTLAVLSVLMAASVSLQVRRDASFPPPTDPEADLYLTSGPVASRLVLEYQALTADLYWIRAIQHYGGTRRALAAAAVPPGAAPLPDLDYRLLYPLLDLTTTLDPQFAIAYRFGATFLAEPYPGGPGRPDLAIALLEKGLRERPDRWEYQRDIGFVYYWWVHDYRAAAEAFDRAGQTPGAPWWLKSLAATTLAQGGDRRSSRLMWETIREVAENDWLRANAEHRLSQLTALDQLESLQQLVDRYAARGRLPETWETLVRAGLLRGTPVDPAGLPYTLSPEGRVRLSDASPLYPLPDEPIRIGGVS